MYYHFSFPYFSTIFHLYAVLTMVGRNRFPGPSWVKGKVISAQCVWQLLCTVHTQWDKTLSSTTKGLAGIPGTPGIPGKRGYRVGLEWHENPDCLIVLLSVHFCLICCLRLAKVLIKIIVLRLTFLYCSLSFSCRLSEGFGICNGWYH